MKNWRLAKSLEQLRSELNNEFPMRSKISDGSIGDVSHSSRSSDHNPNEDGVVCAIDVTNDPASGLSGSKLSEALLASRDPRLKYVIWNRQIAASYATGGKQSWEWRPYSGVNAHQHHVHVSVKSDYDSTEPWNLNLDVATIADVTAPKADVPTQLVKPSGTGVQLVKPSGTGVQLVPNALVAPALVVSKPDDPPIEATTGGFKSMMTSVVGWATGSGAALIAMLKDNKVLLIGSLALIALAGLAYFIRQLILDRDRLKIAADPTKWNAK